MNFWHEVKKQAYCQDHIFNMLKVNIVNLHLVREILEA